MTPARPARFRGLFAAVHSPMNRGGRLNSGRVAEQHELLLESGVAGAFLCGTTGEGHSLTVPERRALLESWVRATEGSTPLIAHVGHNSLPDAVRLAKHAASAGATAVAAMAPTYYRPRTLEELIEYLAPIAAAAPSLPFLYYDAPDFNGVKFPTDQLLSWGRMRIPNLAGVKFTSGDMITLQRCLALGDDFDILLGYEDLLLPSLACGIEGAIGVTFNFAAPVYRRIIAACEAGDLATARAEQGKASELGQVLREFGVVPASKAIMALLGVDCGSTRLPLTALDDRAFAELYERIRSMDVFARALGTPAEVGRRV